MSDWMQVGLTTAQLIDTLEEEYGDTVEVDRVMVIVEIIGGRDTDDEWTGIHFRSTENRRWIQAGLLQAAMEAVDESRVPRFWDEDEEDDE